MKNVFKILFVLFLINNASLCAAQQDNPGIWDRVKGFVKKNILNERNINNPLGENCFLCQDEFTQENPAFFVENFCEHYKCHRTCHGNDTCRDSECCMHKLIFNCIDTRYVQCPYNIDNHSRNIVDNELFTIVSFEEYLAKKRKSLFTKAGKILCIASYAGLLVRNIIEKDKCKAIEKMLDLSLFMFCHEVITRALTIIEQSGVVTVKDKCKIITKEFVKNITKFNGRYFMSVVSFYMIKNDQKLQIPFIMNQLIMRMFFLIQMQLHGMLAGYQQTVDNFHPKFRDSIANWYAIGSGVVASILDISSMSSIFIKRLPEVKSYSKEQVLEQLRLMLPTTTIQEQSQEVLHLMAQLLSDYSKNLRTVSSMKKTVLIVVPVIFGKSLLTIRQMMQADYNYRN